MSQTTIQAVASALTQFDFNFKSNDENIFLYFSTEKSQFKVHIYTTFDDQVLSFDAREIIPTEEIQDSDHPAAFAVYLLQENWRTAAGSYEMDRPSSTPNAASC